jgi:hypothetical protein
MPDTRRASGTLMRVLSAALEAEKTARLDATAASLPPRAGQATGAVEPRLRKVPAAEGTEGLAGWRPASEAGRGPGLSRVCPIGGDRPGPMSVKRR